MAYVIKHDFKQTVPYYARLVNDKEFEEIYNPKLATQFDTKPQALKWAKENSSMGDHSKVVDAQQAIEEFDKWADAGMVRRVLSCINKSKSRPYNNESIDEVIDWKIYQRFNESEIKYEDYRTWPSLYSISKHLWDISAYWDCNYTQLYITFQIYTNQDGDFAEFEQELNRVMDKVTYKDEEGYLIFPIFDHFLSEHGDSVSLLIHPETKKVKVDGRYSYDDREFASLEKAFEYIKTHRYYE